MGAASEISDRLWQGAPEVSGVNSWAAFQGLDEVVPGVAFIGSFANVVAMKTTDGLVLIDTASRVSAPMVKKQLRGWTKDPVHAIVYTHGHVDHVCGTELFDQEAMERKTARPIVYAHERVPDRFARYRLTRGYQGHINARQFGVPPSMFPAEFREPDELYREQVKLAVGGVRFELKHDRGETDDHTWVWVPDKRLLLTGDLFIWASPNCGNPQKVQRFPREWAQALEKMKTLDAEVLLPGHGPPIFGADRVRQALTETAALLTTLHDQTVELMNQGLPLDAILERVQAPKELLERPYLRPVYDEPGFVVRNLWRLYGGWYDGNPSHWKPAREKDLAAAVAALAGGTQKLLHRAKEYAQAGQLDLASHFIEWAHQCADARHQDAVLAARAEIYEARAAQETGLMSRNLFRSVAKESKSQ
jgi:alkyl sulfatase BDS1-like metallo-beta-lactamase superfamily hydrolase